MGRGARRSLVTLLMLGVLAPLASAGEAQDRADAVLRAWRAEDETALGALAGHEKPDPYLVADVLFGRYAMARLAGGDDAPVVLAAARAYAHDGPLLVFVGTWETLETDDLKRGVRLASVWARMEAARDRRTWKELVEILAAAKADLEAGLDTVAVVGIHREAARARANLRQVQAALQSNRSAAEAAERIGWLTNATTLWHMTSRFASSNGEFAAALEAATRAVEAVAASGSERPRPVLRHDLAIATYRTGRLRDAIPLAHDARREAVAAGDAHTAARVLNTLVNIHRMLGELSHAIELAQQAIQESDALGDTEATLKTKANLAGVFARSGRFAEAIQTCEEVLASPEAKENPQLRAVTAGNLAGTFLKLDKVEEAILYLERALETAREAGLDALVAGLEAGLATALLRTEEIQQSPAVLERVQAYYERTGNRRAAARVLLTLAHAYDRLEQTEKAAEIMARALAAFEALGDLLCAARVHSNFGRSHEARDNWDEALKSHQEALRALRTLGLRVDDTALALLGCARVHIRRGCPDDALPFLSQATDIYIDLLHGLGEEDAMGIAARVRHVSDWGVNAAEDMLDLHPQRHAEAAAIAYHHMESARAILLSEALANAKDLLSADLPSDIRREEHDSRAGVEQARRQLVELATKGGEAEAIARAKEALDEAWRVRKACVARVQRTARRAATLAFPEVTPLAELQRSLDDGTVLVMYRFLEVCLAVVVTREDAHLVRLGETEPIRAAIRSYLEVASTPEIPESKLAARLYAELIEPLEHRIGDAKHLVISPDGELAYLPFGALLDAAAEPAERLIQRHTVSMVPSATVLGALRGESPASPGEHVLCVGDPVYPSEEDGHDRSVLRRLPRSGTEATEIGAHFPANRRTVLLREDATVERFLDAVASASGRFRAIHLACHALVDGERPRGSGLALTGAAMLDVDAILGVRIPADLAVLSACETARGKLAQGEGVMGFVRAFFHAGVPRVVVSSWQISDQSTQPFMKDFYEGLVKAGLSPAEALRQAQVHCLENGGTRAHPYHWAAFTLWGLDP